MKPDSWAYAADLALSRVALMNVCRWHIESFATINCLWVIKLLRVSLFMLGRNSVLFLGNNKTECSFIMKKIHNRELHLKGGLFIAGNESIIVEWYSRLKIIFATAKSCMLASLGIPFLKLSKLTGEHITPKLLKFAPRG